MLMLFVINLQILLVTVISITWAKTENVGRSARAPQSQIKYDDSGEYEGFSDYSLSKIRFENLGPGCVAISSCRCCYYNARKSFDFHIPDL